MKTRKNDTEIKRIAIRYMLLLIVVILPLSLSCQGTNFLSPEVIFNKNNEAVVLIRGYDKNGNVISIGSGVNIHSEGKIITNLHVLNGDNLSFDVKFQKHGVLEMY